MFELRKGAGWIFGLLIWVARYYRRPVWVIRGLAVILFAAKPIFAITLYLVFAFLLFRWIKRCLPVSKPL